MNFIISAVFVAALALFLGALYGFASKSAGKHGEDENRTSLCFGAGCGACTRSGCAGRSEPASAGPADRIDTSEGSRS